MSIGVLSDLIVDDILCHSSDLARRSRRAPPQPRKCRVRRLFGACAVSIAFTQEHDVRESIRRFLEQRSSTQGIRRLMESQDTYDPAVWEQLAQQGSRESSFQRSMAAAGTTLLSRSSFLR